MGLPKLYFFNYVISLNSNVNFNDFLFMANKYIHTYTHTYIHADDSTFSLKNLTSVKELLNAIEILSSFTSLKPNLIKCDISRIVVLKGAVE